LRLEITESAIMDNALVARTTLEGLHGLNIPLCMDDFGTGYSSLSYLHQFPIDHLKIDRSFIQQMDSEDEGVQIVSTIISLGHNLGMQVVAEGLETRAQVDRVKELGCDFGQGYYFARPMDEPSAAALLLGELRPAAN
jgi:EAL domain-containing protein (putative c-di-GMP-specific phosphodiesterase class I)